VAFALPMLLLADQVLLLPGFTTSRNSVPLSYSIGVN
jgi:hypothetical protein